MDITVYLPDELGQRAKAAGLNLSRMLRGAVEEELDRMETLKKTAAAPQVHELDLQTDDTGQWYIGRLTGTLLGETDDVGVYLTDDENGEYLAFHQPGEGKIHYVDVDQVDAVTISNWVGQRDQDLYVSICSAVGIKAIVDL